MATTIITVNGRIAAAAWIEAYGAQKVRGQKYFEYVLELDEDDERLTEIRNRLNEEQQELSGIWWSECPGWDKEFHLEQIVKLAALVKSEKVKEQLRTIYREVRSEGEGAWERHRWTLKGVYART